MDQTRTDDAPEIYMLQFWRTVHYDLTTKAYIFTIDDQNFDVNADALSKALQITPEVSDHPFTTPPLENEFISFINKLGKATMYDRPRLPKLQSMGKSLRAEDLVFRMPIPTVMLNDDIKTSVAYAEYLTKSSGTQPATGKGKGLITKKDFEVALKNIGVPRKKWSETVFKESTQSEGVEADTMNSEETEKEDEIPLVQIKLELSLVDKFTKNQMKRL
ncbi:hypothetical protein Tco_0709898 [Tanacetum coccineum]